jgi:hypothetical protein
MTFRERSSDIRQEAPRTDAGGPAGGDLSRTRQAGEAFLRAGDEAIRRALSGNSEAFLAAARQQGGQ